jgi:hypothetical protein
VALNFPFGQSETRNPLQSFPPGQRTHPESKPLQRHLSQEHKSAPEMKKIGVAGESNEIENNNKTISEKKNEFLLKNIFFCKNKIKHQTLKQ